MPKKEGKNNNKPDEPKDKGKITVIHLLEKNKKPIDNPIVVISPTCGCKKKKTKILFVLKRRGYCGHSYGLIVSCQMVAKSLNPYGYDCKIVTVTDSNNIDAEIYKFKPHYCFLEALYVPPYKLFELFKLHKDVKFNIRIHSKIEFLAQESIAFQWLTEYKQIAKAYNNFTLSGNNIDFVNEMNDTLGYDFLYTPNCYPISGCCKTNIHPIGTILSVGAFGALRILKNHLQMAMGAIFVANSLDKKLRFHINNSATIEKEGNSILKNLISLFKDTRHELIIHNWETHPEFLEAIKTMDIVLQISMSESFNLLAADGISFGIPIVGSKEIKFLSPWYQAETTNFEDIVRKIEFALKYKTIGLHTINEILLRKHNRNAIKSWLKILH
jgi:hypothetical protein